MAMELEMLLVDTDWTTLENILWMNEPTQKTEPLCFHVMNHLTSPKHHLEDRCLPFSKYTPFEYITNNLGQL